MITEDGGTTRDGWTTGSMSRSVWRAPITEETRRIYIDLVGEEWIITELWKEQDDEISFGTKDTIVGPFPTLDAAKAAWLVIYGS